MEEHVWPWYSKVHEISTYTCIWKKYKFIEWVKVEKQEQVHETSSMTWYKYNYMKQTWLHETSTSIVQTYMYIKGVKVHQMSLSKSNEYKYIKWLHVHLASTTTFDKPAQSNETST